MSFDISIIIPTYNRKDNLRRCLESLCKQDYPAHKVELIVIDDSKDANTITMLEDFKKTHRNLKYFTLYHQGPAAARNLGVEVSGGEIIGFIDDDCIAGDDWIRLMIETHRRNPEVAAVGGMTLTSTKQTSVLISQFLSTHSIETHINSRREIIFFPTCNVSFKRCVFEKNRFEENFTLPGGEDLEFFWRLFKEGNRFIWNKDIKIIHSRDKSTCSFLRQAFTYGQGNFLVQYLHGDHPLLKELSRDNIFFWMATFINILKITRFCYLLGNRLIQENNIKGEYKKLSVYSYLMLHKILYLAGNIKEYFKIKRLNPTHLIPNLVILDITHRCNLNCKICDIWKTATYEKDLHISYIKKLLSQVKTLGIKEIAFSGGEPLLRNDILEIFNHAKNLRIKNLGILTNGLSITKLFNKLIPYLLDNTITLVISLDSLNPQIHNYIRNSNQAWHCTIDGLRLVSELKKKSHQINFNIITIIMNQNLEELFNLAVYSKSLGANTLQFQPLLSNNLNMAERKRTPFWIPEDRLALLDETVDKLTEFAMGNPGFIRNSIKNLVLVKKYFRGEIGLEDISCMSARKSILISNRGICTTCFSGYGDIKRESLKDILQDKKIILARNRVRNCRWPCLLPCFCDN